jgi:predicted RNA binding protein YcfA (HicA-like mRNA interferase family)
MKSKDVIKKLVASGWIIKNIKGSHYHLIHADHPGLKVQVALHHGDLPKGTLNNIKKITGVDL